MDDSPMFLDVVELVIHLPDPTESTFTSPDFSFNNRKVWKVVPKSWGIEYVFNRSKQFLMIDGGKYKPHFTYRIRKDWRHNIHHEILLRFSIPKLLFGNNFTDVPKSSLNELYRELLYALYDLYGFKDITMEMLTNSTLKRMECGSQVFFPDITAYNQARDRIRSVRLDQRIDKGDIEYAGLNYADVGTGFRIHCKSWDFVFYNKTEELKHSAKSKGRAKFEEDNECMIGVWDYLPSDTEPSTDECDSSLSFLTTGEGFYELITTSGEVCARFELKLGQKSHIDTALEHIGEPTGHITLEDALIRNIPQRILQWHCQRLFGSLPRYDLTSTSNEDLLDFLLTQDMKPDAIAKSLGYITMERMPDQRRLREAITNGKSRSAWASYLKKIENIPRLSDRTDPIQPILDVVFNLGVTTPNTSKNVKMVKSIVFGVAKAICITISFCTKNKHFLWIDWLVRHVSARAPPSRLAVRRGAGEALKELSKYPNKMIFPND